MPKKKKNINAWYNLAKRIAVIAGFFTVIIAILLLINYFQTKSIDPLKVEAITRLIEQLKENPQDIAIKEQIRALDLLARKAFFIGRWQIRTGSYLLFGFSLIFLIALKSLHSLKARFPEFLKTAASQDTWEHKLLSRRYILRTALGLLLLVIILGFLSESALDKIGKSDPGEMNSAEDYPQVEEIRKNWPGFRGPEGIGISYHKNLPLEWDGKSGKNISGLFGVF